MITEEKLEKIKELADAMYYAAQHLTTDASRLHKAMDEYHKFIINEYHKEEPDEELEEKALLYSGSHAPYDDCMQEVKNAYIDGYKESKQQMMTQAVDGEVTYGKSLAIPSLGYRLDKERLDFGDKVKVIIIKED